MRNKLYLCIAAIAFLSVAWVDKPEDYILIAQPYALTVEEISPALLARCRTDENCMDIDEFRDYAKADCGQHPEGSDAWHCCVAPELDPNLCGGGK